MACAKAAERPLPAEELGAELASLSGSDDDAPAPAEVSSMKKGAPRRTPSKAKRGNTKAPVGSSVLQHSFTEQELAQARPALLKWYDANHRVLPWRRTPHSTRTTPAPAGQHEAAAPAPASLDAQAFAYQVLVSEVMLQQTQVATVIPYFQKWVARWPTVAELAVADVEQVNAAWAGLGYYRRARYLLEGAKYVVDKLGGQYPTTAKAMLAIPGVGPYTAAAVASIAFGDPAAAVDGNVVRVVSRLRALAGDPTGQGATHSAIAQQLLDAARPGDWNQAMMELGARVCKPAVPDCTACPLSRVCTAHAEWRAYLDSGGCADVEDAPVVTRFPGRKEAKAKKEQRVAVCVLEVVTSKTRVPSAGAGSAVPTGSPLPAPGQGSKGPRKRQASMFDFMAAAPAAKAVKAGGGTEAAGSAAAAQPAAVAQLLADPARRHVLLVQRPAEGLLAGLWEMPGVVLEDGEATSYAHRRARLDVKLAQLLGLGLHVDGVSPSTPDNGLKATVMRRHDVGTYVHVFSHIRQTNYVERLVVLVEDEAAFLAYADPLAAQGDAESSSPAVRWVRGSKIQEESTVLSTGPLKMYDLAVGCGGEGVGSKGSRGTKAGKGAARQG